MFDNMPENVRSAIILALEKIEDPDGKKAKSSGMFSWVKHQGDGTFTHALFGHVDKKTKKHSLKRRDPVSALDFWYRIYERDKNAMINDVIMKVPIFNRFVTEKVAEIENE